MRYTDTICDGLFDMTNQFPYLVIDTKVGTSGAFQIHLKPRSTERSELKKKKDVIKKKQKTKNSLNKS